MNLRRWRGLCALLVVVAVPVLGLLLHTGGGTLSALGIDAVAALCPVGALEAMLGAKSVVLHGLICLGITVLLVVALGKVLCAWACPVPWLQKFFRGKKESAKESPACSTCEKTSPCGNEALPPVGGARDGVRLDSRHVVLAGALGSSALFGFPVFCLICPIGLTFATLIGLWQLFSLNETSWGLLLFPALLILEVTLLRKWCTKICPVSALLSLIASANRTLRPSVAKTACLREKGVDCTACVEACPEQVDPHSALIPECSKCGQCAEKCPVHAISFPLRRR